MKILLVILGITFLIAGCSSSTSEVTKPNNDKAQVEPHKEKLTKQDQKYIDTAISTFKQAQETEKENNPYKFNGLQLKYSSIVKTLDKVKTVPEELEKQIEEIKTISLEREKHYSQIQADQSAKVKRERELAEIKAQNEINGVFGTPKTVLIGMTVQEVLTIGWGKPNDINRTITAYGTKEQWVYGNGNYLYFEDGILTSIQN